MKKNIFFSLLIKCLSIVTGLLIVPLTIDYVKPSQYGIWLTLSSIVAWLSFFDIGFGNGFRNKFTIARANNDNALARIYISTIYVYLGIIFFIVWIFFISLNSHINWIRLLNFNPILANEVSTVAVIIFTYFCLQFILKIVGTILIADQKAAKASLIDLISQLFTLLIIYIITKFSNGSLLNLSIALSISPMFVLVLANMWFFRHDFKMYRPSISLAKLKYARDLLDLGGKFFVIQIAGIIQYQTTNLLIAYHFNTEEVTTYNIAFKYFSILVMVFSILLLPLWSAVTEAYEKKDFVWIKSAVMAYLKIWVFFTFCGFLMLWQSDYFYNFWIGYGKVQVPFVISFWSLIFSILSLFAGLFVTIINGFGTLKIQFFMCFITPIIFISLSYILIHFLSLGVESIIIASIISNVTGVIILPVQYLKIINGKKGIWAS